MNIRSNGDGLHSIDRRNHLKQHYVQVPDMSPLVPIARYLQLCVSLFSKAEETFRRKTSEDNYLNISYIEFQKFVKLCDMISKHKNFEIFEASPVGAVQIKQMIALLVKAEKYLKEIVLRMDYEEIKRKESEMDKNLMNEFDNDQDGSNIIVSIPAKEDFDILSTPVRSNSTIESIPLNTDPKDQSKLSISERLKILNLNKNSESATEAKSISRGGASDNLKTYHLPSFQYSDTEIPAEIKGITPQQPSWNTDDQGVDNIVTIDIPITSNQKVYVKVPNGDVQILRSIGNIAKFQCPSPFSTILEIKLGAKGTYVLIQDDFHVSYQSFLWSVRPELQMTRSAMETNRCFFLHLGIGLNIHPFALQTALRYQASAEMLLIKNTPDEWTKDILTTILDYAGFVDANALCLLWMSEFNPNRICLISGPLSKPIFSCFYLGKPSSSNEMTSSHKYRKDLRDIIIRCDGFHFTLLRPQTTETTFNILNSLLQDAEAQGLIVQYNEIDPSKVKGSVNDIVNHLIDRR